MLRTISVARATIILLLVCSTVTARAHGEALFGPGKLSGMSDRLRLGVFSSIDFLADSSADESSAVEIGAVDLFATAQLSDRWSGLAELVFENLDGELVTDLERLQLMYNHNDALGITLGRVHSPLVQWNVEQHHGTFLQTSIDKPTLSNWEDEPGIWPVHFVGVLAGGHFESKAGFLYEVGIGNGRGGILDDVQTTGDKNSAKATIVSVGLAPPGAPGLEVRATGYFDTIPAVSGELKETDYTISARYVEGNVELRSEWSRMRHRPVAGNVDYDTTGWYVLFSYALPGKLAAVRPYLLLDNLDVDEREAFFEGAEDVAAWVVGLRWDFVDWIALKADYRSEEIGDAKGVELVRASVAFAF